MLEIWLPTAGIVLGPWKAGRHQLGRSWPYWAPSSSGPPTDAKANQGGRERRRLTIREHHLMPSPD